MPVEIAGQACRKTDGERHDAVGCRNRINRVGTDEVANQADTSTHPGATHDPGQHGAGRVEKERELQSDGEGMTRKIQAERRQDQDEADRVESESERTPTGGIE